MNLPKTLLSITLALAATFTSHAGPISKGGYVIAKPGKYFLTKKHRRGTRTGTRLASRRGHRRTGRGA